MVVTARWPRRVSSAARHRTDTGRCSLSALEDRCRALAVDEGGHGRAHLSLERGSRCGRDLSIGRSLVDPRIRGGRQLGDETVAALPGRGVRDIAKALAFPERFGEVRLRDAE